MKNADQAKIREYLCKRYAGDFHRIVAVRDFLDSICTRHVSLGLGDTNLADKLCAGDEYIYWQQLSEVLLGHELLEAGLTLTPSHNGPDFLVQHQRQRIWIEVICPKPEGLPPDWLTMELSKPVSMPHEALLLRWTAAIKEKAEKLLGNPAKKLKGYIEKGIVGSNDAYVIAVNARLLRGRNTASITGISQFPFAVEAVFSVGPITVTMDYDTLEITGSKYQHRPIIKKPNGSPVPAYTFLDPAFKPVSAVWAADIDETWIIGNAKPIAVVHNPNATNPVLVGLLPSYEEYVATPNGEEYILSRNDGRLLGGLSQ